VAEDALRKSEKELRDVIDTIPAIVWSTLPDGSNTYVNKRYVEYTGSSPEQVAGSGWEALIHPDDLERHAASSCWAGVTFYFFRRYMLSAWITLATVPVLLVYKIAVIGWQWQLALI